MSTAVDTASDTRRRLAPDTARVSAASWLQRLVPELFALALDAKQAHWHVTGPAFLPMHQLTDDIADAALAGADRIAERALALGFVVDARARTVASAAGDLPAGYLTEREVIDEITSGIDRAAASARRSLADLEASDAVAHDITVELLEVLEKHRWMLQAHRA